MGEAAWSWVLGQVREADGPWLPDSVPGPEEPGVDRDCLYAGIAGLAPVLAEFALTRELSARERALSAGIVSRLVAQERTETALYDIGLAGDVVALRLLAPGSEASALQRISDLRTPAGWASALSSEMGTDHPMSDVIMGTAGVMMTALWVGNHLEIAETGGEALLQVAERTEHGLDWRMFPDYRVSSPNFSHGTAGVASALALAGWVLGRQDFVDAAIDGARHVIALGSHADGSFVLPHTIPNANREVEPLTYTWCHGPTGTSQLFPALALAGVDQVGGHRMEDLRAQCLQTVLDAGVPQRLRPGFWDNDGRCCGTAGVGDVLLDLAQDTGEQRWLDAAATMGRALLGRAVDGTYWQFVEYRDDEPLLPPGTSWMQGAAGIAAFLLRLDRVQREGLDAKVVDRPDQWWSVPAGTRTVRR